MVWINIYNYESALSVRNKLNILGNDVDILKSQIYINVIGNYDAETNTPDIITTIMKPGEARAITVMGTQFGINFLVGDFIVRNKDDTGYFKIDNTDIEIINNLTSIDIDKALSANQGKILKDSLDYIENKNIINSEGLDFSIKLEEQRELQFAGSQSIFGDGQPANYDPNFQMGFYFKKLETPEIPTLVNKINWYFWFDLQPFGSGIRMKVSDLKSIYAKLLIYNSNSIPWISVYTKPQGDGQDVETWYRSLFNYQTQTSSIKNNSEILMYAKEEPIVDNIYKVKMEDGSGEGLREEDEEILYITLQSNSNAGIGEIEFLCKKFGLKNNNNYINYILNSYELISPLEKNNLNTKSISFTNQSTITIDHNKEYTPLVQVYDEENKLIIAEIEHLTLNTFIVRMNSVITGTIIYY